MGDWRARQFLIARNATLSQKACALAHAFFFRLFEIASHPEAFQINRSPAKRWPGLHPSPAEQYRGR